MPTWLETSRHAPAGDILRTRQLMPPARLKEIVPAFRARKRCNLCLSSIAASVDTRHPRDGREVCLLARRQTETADGIVGLPICRAMTLPTTTRTEAKA